MIILAILIFILLVVNMMIGGVEISVSDIIAILGNEGEQMNINILEIRLIKTLTALFCGVTISVSGLLMQTMFKNPLAGPYILGISSGASLGAAIFVIGFPTIGLGILSNLGLVSFAWIGAILVQLIIGILARRIKNITSILILGMMLGSGIAALVQTMQYFSDATALKSYIIWTMGTLSSITPLQLAILGGVTTVGMVLSFTIIKPLNLILLGDDFARSLGVNLKKSLALIFICTSLMAGTVTAFCGPIAFIGIAIPHIARSIKKTTEHRIMIPYTALLGAVIMLGCNIISKLLDLPINIITSFLGIPVVFWIVIKRK